MKTVVADKEEEEDKEEDNEGEKDKEGGDKISHLRTSAGNAWILAQPSGGRIFRD